ncbi:hypothetical protein JNUCC1_00882 [Lentibacillus sp. JNUCC-1]|nr:hypothetical protein [Lentibacillus sp. JNUCC-1]
MRHLTIQENHPVPITSGSDAGGVSLTREEASQLEVYIEENHLNRDFIVWGNRSIRLINYVGFIQCPYFSMEILPKLSLDEDTLRSRHTLLMMLDEVYQFNITATASSRLSAQPYSLFHIFAKMYAEELLFEFKRGIHGQYRTTERNGHYVKGKVNIQKHVKHNMLKKRPHRVYCSFAEHSHNNVINQLFLATNRLLQKHVKQGDVLSQLHQLNQQLFDVDQVKFTPDMLQNVIIDRNLSRYQTAIHLAILFQKQLTGGLMIGRNEAFSLLFDMSDLYEQYTATLFQRYLPVDISVQDNTHALFNRNGRPAARILPDIVIKQPDNTVIIIDTKWKAYHSGRGIEERDLVQMYKYLNTYPNCQCVYVLYPQAGTSAVLSNNVYTLRNDRNKKVIAKTIPLTDKQTSIQFLEQMTLQEHSTKFGE